MVGLWGRRELGGVPAANNSTGTTQNLCLHLRKIEIKLPKIMSD